MRRVRPDMVAGDGNPPSLLSIQYCSHMCYTRVACPSHPCLDEAMMPSCLGLYQCNNTVTLRNLAHPPSHRFVGPEPPPPPRRRERGVRPGCRHAVVSHLPRHLPLPRHPNTSVIGNSSIRAARAPGEARQQQQQHCSGCSCGRRRGAAAVCCGQQRGGRADAVPGSPGDHGGAQQRRHRGGRRPGAPIAPVLHDACLKLALVL